jgi:hypothetical protein
MIRRGFWLTAGAVTGIYAYRRVSALSRRLSASLNPAGPAQEARPARQVRQVGGARQVHRGARQVHRGARQVHRGAIGAARETYRFTRDVREGMDLYAARHSRSAGSTLSTDHESTTYEPKDGR